MNLKGGVEGICDCFEDWKCKVGLGFWGGMHTALQCAVGCHILGANSIRFNNGLCKEI